MIWFQKDIISLKNLFQLVNLICSITVQYIVIHVYIENQRMKFNSI